MEEIIIQPELESDWDDVYDLNRKAFNSNTEPEIVRKLRNSQEIISLVAVIQGKIVGHILFSRVELITHNQIPEVSVYGLGPMAVLPEYQNKGIGHRLVNEGLEVCKGRKIDLVVVLGHPNYYPKFGFVPAFSFGITNQYGVESEAWMCLDLNDGIHNKIQGQVMYDPAFS